MEEAEQTWSKGINYMYNHKGIDIELKYLCFIHPENAKKGPYSKYISIIFRFNMITDHFSMIDPKFEVLSCFRKTWLDGIYHIFICNYLAKQILYRSRIQFY
jgi:hypothetical protein